MSRFAQRTWNVILDEARGDRLAIDAILAVVAGEDLIGSIERLEQLLDDLPETKKKVKANHTWNDLVERSREMVELAIKDLTLLLDRETAPA